MLAPPNRDPLYLEIASLREQLELRDEEVRQLREMFTPVLAFPPQWRLTSRETSMLAALYAAKGALGKEALHHAVSDLEIETEPKIVDVYICKIRRKVGRFGIRIETLWGDGFRLRGESRAVIARALDNQTTEEIVVTTNLPMPLIIDHEPNRNADPVGILLSLARRPQPPASARVLFDAALALIQSERDALAVDAKPAITNGAAGPRRKSHGGGGHVQAGTGAANGVTVTGDVVSFRGKSITVTKRQAEIAAALAPAMPQMVDRATVAKKVWGRDDSNTIAMVGQQSKELALSIDAIGLKIVTVRGAGLGLDEI
jgi:two-component system cell cycle response regulator CtrA